MKSYRSYFFRNATAYQPLSTSLRAVLSRIYPACSEMDRPDALCIRLCLADDPDLPDRISSQVGQVPESFAVAVEDSSVYLAGRDLQGLRFAIDALAQRLGEGHYLSFHTPVGARDAINPAEWVMQDEPLAKRRILFNWHNFMSGCSGWNEKDWLAWIDRGHQQRLNAIMVHCYSNSPMLEAEVNGVTRPTGWLTTSVKGRDWGAQHVNDVRRIPGARLEDGTNLYNGPAFGAEAGLVPDEVRVPAMKELMARVFDHARSKDMGVYLAVDVDCQTDHPQAILDTLPDEAKIQVQTPSGQKAFVHPEHPQGYAVYRQLVENLLCDFPQVTQLVAWFRGKRNDWGLLSHLRVSEMPEDWVSDYRKREPEFTDGMRLNPFAQPPYLFALSKIVQAFQRALRELGREEVELMCGSWDLLYLDSFHFFVDPSVPLVALDYAIQFESHEWMQSFSRVSAEREVVPMLWAHHDDHSYIGRSYVPVPHLQSRFEQMGVNSFGIIHWTTRPLDLYVKNTCRQVWLASRNEDLAVTTRRMAEDLFGRENSDPLAEYLYLWITASPLFGVETNQKFMSDRFKPFEDVRQHHLLTERRLPLLERLPDADALHRQGREWLSFYKHAERFVQLFYACFEAMRRCEDLPVAEAQTLLRQHSPEQVLEAYARHISHGETTRGELGVLYSMATRWAVYFEELRQIHGLVPVRWSFGTTRHDPLATLPGKYTWFYQEDGTCWMQLGEAETGAKVVENPGGRELEAEGMDLSEGLALDLASWFGRALRVSGRMLTLGLGSDSGELQVDWLDAEGGVIQSESHAAGSLVEMEVPLDVKQVRLRATAAVLLTAVLSTSS